MTAKLRNMTSIYLTYENKILLLYRIGSKISNEMYIGTAGGHFEHDELNDAKACVLRELKEETGLTENDINMLRLRYITLRLKDEEIRQNYYFFAELKEYKNTITSNEGNLCCFSLDEAKKLKMPHSAKYMYLHFLEQGRFNDKLYGGISTKDNVNFTELTEF